MDVAHLPRREGREPPRPRERHGCEDRREAAARHCDRRLRSRDLPVQAPLASLLRGHRGLPHPALRNSRREGGLGQAQPAARPVAAPTYLLARRDGRRRDGQGQSLPWQRRRRLDRAEIPRDEDLRPEHLLQGPSRVRPQPALGLQLEARQAGRQELEVDVGVRRLLRRSLDASFPTTSTAGRPEIPRRHLAPRSAPNRSTSTTSPTARHGARTTRTSGGPRASFVSTSPTQTLSKSSSTSSKARYSATRIWSTRGLSWAH